jgi:hypothetical protein
MIRPLRRTHRRVMLLLALLLPAILVLATAGREAPPVQQPWPIGDRR